MAAPGASDDVVGLVRAFMDAFVSAWPSQDAAALAPFFAPHATYHNVPLDPAVGRAAIVDEFARFMQLGGEVGVELLHVAAEGPVVLTERVDHFTNGTSKVDLPVMGVVEVHDGLITAWRDYFDLGQAVPA